MGKQTTPKLLFIDNAMTTSYSQWIRADLADQNIHLYWTAAGTPVGAFTVELSNDPVIDLEKQRIVNGQTSGNGVPTVSGANSAAKVVDITASITPVFGTGFTVNNGTNAGSTMFALTAGQAKWFRVKYTRNSGSGVLQGTVNGTN